MNGATSAVTTGIQTSHGLAGLLGLALLLIVIFHFAGFRILFTVGRSVG